MAQGSGNVSNLIQLGGFDNSSNIILPEANAPGYFTIYSGATTSAAGDYFPFWKNGVQYQVTSGKTFFGTRLIFTCSTAGEGFQLMSATATFAQGASTVTGGVWQFGAAATYGISVYAANTYYGISTQYQYSASTFPGTQTSGGGSNYMVIMIGKEA